MENLHFTPQNLLLLLINSILLIAFIYGFVRNKIKEGKLEVAMDHYSIVNAIKESKKELITNKVDFTQSYSKTVKLFKQIEGEDGPDMKKYFETHIARILGEELYKAGGVNIEFIQGIEEDKIIGEVRYLIEV